MMILCRIFLDKKLSYADLGVAPGSAGWSMLLWLLYVVVRSGPLVWTTHRWAKNGKSSSVPGDTTRQARQHRFPHSNRNVVVPLFRVLVLYFVGFRKARSYLDLSI